MWTFLFEKKFRGSLGHVPVLGPSMQTNQSIFYPQGDIDELLWGKEYRYKQWITDMRKSMAAYEAKPERIEDGLKVNLSETLKKCP